MKNQTIKIYLVLLATLLLGCSENANVLLPETKDELPPITQTGENTFGCLIDGNIFIPKDKTGYTPPGGGIPKGLEIGIGGNDYFTIIARNYNNIYIYIYIPNGIPLKKEYNFEVSSGLSSGLDSPNHPHAYIVYNNNQYLTFKGSGSINFTNVNNKIYSGNFEIKAESKNNKDSIIQLMQGRFDINIATLNK